MTATILGAAHTMRALFLFAFGLFFLAWCKWTDPGNLFIAKLSEKIGGHPTTELNFDDLRGGMTEGEVKSLHPGADWLCTEDLLENKEEFGQRVCDAPVSYVNGVNAIRLDYLFRDGELGVLIIEYSPDAFPNLLTKMDASYQRSQNTKYFASNDLSLSSREALNSLFRTGEAKDYWGWKTKDGIVVSSETEKNYRGNVIAFWASDNFINKHLNGRRIAWNN